MSERLRLDPKLLIALATGALIYGGIHFSRSSAEPDPTISITPPSLATHINLPPITPTFIQIETDLTTETFCSVPDNLPMLRVTTFPKHALVGKDPYYISYAPSRDKLNTSDAQYIALTRQTTTNPDEDAPYAEVVNASTIGINPIDNNTPIIPRPNGTEFYLLPTYTSSSNFTKSLSETVYAVKTPKC